MGSVNEGERGEIRRVLKELLKGTVTCHVVTVQQTSGRYCKIPGDACFGLVV